MSDHNSLVPHIKAYIQAIFSDITWLYGAKRKDCDRDCARLLTQLDRHGIRVVCIDLPAVAKLFDQSLDQGYLQIDESFLTRKTSAAVKVPKFLGILYLGVFDNDGKLRVNASPDCIAAIRQILLGLKKLELECTERSINNEIQDFLDIEAVLRRPNLDWDTGWVEGQGRYLSFYDSLPPRDGKGRFVKKPSGLLRSCLDTLHQVCDISTAMFGDCLHDKPYELPKHGPGVVSNQKRGEWKFHFPNWSERLDSYFPYSHYAVANEGLVQDGSNLVSRIEYDSRLICVPKTLKGPRLIAAEPVENQYAQQLVRSQLEHRMGYIPIARSIDFRSQERNQKLAIEGSITGALATVDLSSASDRLSCWTIERVFRNNPGLLSRMWSCRTAGVSLSTFRGFPTRVSLRKYSTMGSACTFPVQSIVYALMAVSCVLHGRRVSIKSIREAAKMVQVFGDDIVVPTNKLHLLKEMLSYFQLKVNDSKTYEGSNFRESCGVDAFRGTDVTPVYAKHLSYREASLGYMTNFVALSNNLFKKGLWNTSDHVRSWANDWNQMIPIISSSKGDFGYYSYCGRPDYTKSLRTRWNKALHRREYKVVKQKCETTISKVDHPSSLLAWFLHQEQGQEHITSNFSRMIELLYPSSMDGIGSQQAGPSSLKVGWDPLYA